MVIRRLLDGYLTVIRRLFHDHVTVIHLMIIWQLWDDYSTIVGGLCYDCFTLKNMPDSTVSVVGEYVIAPYPL